ncbi:MAG: DUF2085 domain-containing protein [Bacteroidetes bacterium]|nr:DUF2085 domain-containing protein [Bacteroidota bacterium]MCP4800457.1 DUF2085 domain-containing protein [bacterium]
MKAIWNRSILAIIIVVAGSLVAIAICAPIIQHFRGYPYGEELYRFLHPICHQYPTRSLWVFDRPLGLCTRCLSGYLGVMFAVFFRRWWWGGKKRFVIGLLLLALAILDPIVQLNTSYISSNPMRFLTGALGGFAVSLMFMPVFSLQSKGKLR